MKNVPLPYCEKINAAAEPLNVATNAGFLLVSLSLIILIWHRAVKTDSRFISSPLLMVSLLPALIGFGSAAYHFRRSNLTLMMDLVPIGVFAGVTLYLCLRFILGQPKVQASRFFMMWAVATAIAAPWPAYAYGSLIYLPTLIALSGVAVVSRHRLIVSASVVFTIALTLRTLDLPLCEQLKTGTHPLWHILAAVVSLLLLLALLGAMQTTPYDQSRQQPRSHTN